MKFSVKLKKINVFKRSPAHARKRPSSRDLSMITNEIKSTKKNFRFSPIKTFTWQKKKDGSTSKLPILSSPRIEELENEFMNVLEKMNNISEMKTSEKEKYARLVDSCKLNDSWKQTIEGCHQYQTIFRANRRLLITRSVDDFVRAPVESYLCSSFSSQFLGQLCLKNTARSSNHSDILLSNSSKNQIQESINSSVKLFVESVSNKKNLPLKISLKCESYLEKQNPSSEPKPSLDRNETSLKLIPREYQQQEAAIIEVEHQSYPSSSLSVDINRKSLEKSYSSPLPMNRNHSSIIDKYIQSAHMIGQGQYENGSGISSYSYVTKVESDQSTTNSISSDKESVKQKLLRDQDNANEKYIRRRWSLFDMWETTMTKLPPILNCIWRQRLYATGSREFRRFLLILYFHGTLTKDSFSSA